MNKRRLSAALLAPVASALLLFSAPASAETPVTAAPNTAVTVQSPGDIIRDLATPAGIENPFIPPLLQPKCISWECRSDDPNLHGYACDGAGCDCICHNPFWSGTMYPPDWKVIK